MSGSPYSDKCDVYSFGIILWELYCRKHPFEEFNFTFMMILEEKIVKEHLRFVYIFH
jgi:serine/threonine protein kinase